MKRTVFEERQSLLAKNGFVSYTKYLKSDTWKRIRIYVLKRDAYQCRLCGEGEKLVAHHMLYDTASLFSDPRKGGKKKLKNVVTLCETCHERVHTSIDGKFKHIGLDLEPFLLATPKAAKDLQASQDRRSKGKKKKKKKGKGLTSMRSKRLRAVGIAVGAARDEKLLWQDVGVLTFMADDPRKKYKLSEFGEDEEYSGAILGRLEEGGYVESFKNGHGNLRFMFVVP